MIHATLRVGDVNVTTQCKVLIRDSCRHLVGSLRRLGVRRNIVFDSSVRNWTAIAMDLDLLSDVTCSRTLAKQGGTVRWPGISEGPTRGLECLWGPARRERNSSLSYVVLRGGHHIRAINHTNLCSRRTLIHVITLNMWTSSMRSILL